MSYVHSTRDLKSDAETLHYARERRARNAAAARCINHDSKPAQIGCRCIDCYWVHAIGKQPSVATRSLALQRELRRIGATR